MIHLERDITFIKPDKKKWPFLFEKSSLLGEAAFENGNSATLCGRGINLQDLKKAWSRTEWIDDDPEFVDSLHRFHWLLQFAETQWDTSEIADILDAIIQWKNSRLPRSIRLREWQPYNVSERIVNIVTFLQTLNEVEYNLAKTEKVVELISEDVDYLLLHLEYPASGIVNNHILNNARAIYFAGIFFDCDSLVDIAKEMIRSHVPDLISETGYLLESSSHYQLVLTRTIVEIFKLASLNLDTKFERDMSVISAKMVTACQSLLCDRHGNLKAVPRHGDLSPDIATDWFLPIHEPKNHGWKRIWNVSFAEIDSTPVNEDGWHKFDNENYTIISYSHPNTVEYPCGHGHSDFGGFSLFYRSLPIFVEVGRYSYATSQKYLQLSADDRHNSLYLSDAPIVKKGIGLGAHLNSFISQRKYFVKDCENKSIKFCSTSHSDGMSWQRTVKFVNCYSMIVEDLVQAEGPLTLFFNLAPDISVTEANATSIKFLIGDIRFRMSFENSMPLIVEECYIYESYGEKTRTLRLRWSPLDRADVRESVLRINAFEKKT